MIQQKLQHDLQRHGGTARDTGENQPFGLPHGVVPGVIVSRPDAAPKGHVANVNVVGSSPITRFDPQR